MLGIFASCDRTRTHSIRHANPSRLFNVPLASQRGSPSYNQSADNRAPVRGYRQFFLGTPARRVHSPREGGCRMMLFILIRLLVNMSAVTRALEGTRLDWVQASRRQIALALCERLSRSWRFLYIALNEGVSACLTIKPRDRPIFWFNAPHLSLGSCPWLSTSSQPKHLHYC